MDTRSRDASVCVPRESVRARARVHARVRGLLASPVPLREKGDTTRSLGSATLRTTCVSRGDDGFLVGNVELA